MLDLIRKNPVTFSIAAVQTFHENTKHYLNLLEDLGIDPKPKDHTLQHQTDHVLRLGSPAYYANWLDESINRLLRDVAGGAHQAVFYRRILKEFQAASDGRPNAKRRRLR